MIVYQAVSMYLDSEPLAEQVQKPPLMLIVGKDLPTLRTAVH